MLIIKFILGIVISLIIIVILVSVFTFLAAHDCLSDNTCKLLLKQKIDNFFEKTGK